MKSYDELLKDLYTRRDIYLAEKRMKRKRIIKISGAAAVLVLICALGVLMWMKNHTVTESGFESHNKDYPINIGESKDNDGSDNNKSVPENNIVGNNHEKNYFYDPAEYKIVKDENIGNRIIPHTLDELEKQVQECLDNDNNHCGLIAEFTVVGPSINRIIEPTDEERDPSKVYGVNHVLTCVKIEKVYYGGEQTGVEEGKVYFLNEPYFYIEKGMEPYYGSYGENTIISKEYSPLQKENRYIVFGYYDSNEIYDFKGNTVIGTLGLQEAVYFLGDESTAKTVVDYDNENYWSLWKEVVEKYKG